jgi:SEC-C motif
MIAEPVDAERGMLDLDQWDRHNGGIARCCAADCDWEGIPIRYRGNALTACPSCEKETVEAMIALGAAPKPRPPKQGRNELCACGSGLKHKRCCAL